MRRIFPKTIVCLLVAIFVYSGSTVLAAPTIGSISTSAAKFGACTLAGKISPFLSDWIDSGYDRLNKSIAKLIAKIPGLSKIPGLGGAVGGIVGGDSVPVSDEGLNNIQSKILGKETSGDIATRCAAMEVLNFMNTSITDLARNSGRNGGASWVRNWRNFQTESQYRGEGIFRSELSNTNLCNYFGESIKTLFGANNKISLPGQNTRTGNFDPFTLRNNCTMPSGFNLSDYQNDFSGNGGWQAWSRMLQPQNNYYGSLFNSLDEAEKQRSLEESADLNQVIANRGFTGRSGENAADSCSQRDSNGKCLAYKDIKTPGSVIADSIAASIKTELDVTLSADEISELISTATEVLINRLKDLSNPDEGDYLAYTPPEVSEPTGPGNGTCSNPLPVPPGSPPNMSGIVQQVASDFPEYLTNSCQDTGGTWQFMDEVVSRLHAQDPNWGYNGKRGNTGDLSKDAVSYLAGGTTSVFIIDIIGGHCGDNPQPAWNDVTAETYQCGVTGAYVYPRGSGGGGGGETPTPEPVI